MSTGLVEMAGRGPAPKDPSQRRRYNQPARGEWVDLEPLGAPVLREWDDRFTVRAEMWAAWRRDAVTSQYGEADIVAIEDLAIEWEAMTFADRDRRLDRLGLTPKGKRDLRWRTPAEAATVRKQGAKVHRLKVVAPDAVAGA